MIAYSAKKRGEWRVELYKEDKAGYSSLGDGNNSRQHSMMLEHGLTSLKYPCIFFNRLWYGDLVLD